MDEELKPCWSCKSPVKFKQNNRYTLHFEMWIECSKCCMGTYPIVGLKSQRDLCVHDLIKEWNERV